MLIYVKMPTIVGIFTLMSTIDFMLSGDEQDKEMNRKRVLLNNIQNCLLTRIRYTCSYDL